ncbi:hypothetical protein ABEX30_20375 [Priestia aryabhattai]|uniref:hypothetical protein n=1 Tax=Priestia aryabhattai TaxID=412384 RepID=UPI003D297F57
MTDLQQILYYGSEGYFTKKVNEIDANKLTNAYIFVPTAYGKPYHKPILIYADIDDMFNDRDYYIEKDVECVTNIGLYEKAKTAVKDL